MTDDERLQKLKDDYRDAPIAQIEYELGRRLRGSDEYQVLQSLSNEARAAADAPEQQRHREFKLVHWIGAAIAFAGVVALWIQACRPSQPSAAPANPPTAISPVPTPAESPAVTPPARTPEESARTPEESVRTLEESVPAPEESVPAPEESAPTPEELVPAPEESVPTPVPTP
jgi:cytoskeletal protein RodZ